LNAILFFVPFLILLLYQKSLPKCLWAAFLCGILQECIFTDGNVKIAAIFVAATAILFYVKRFFFADSKSTLPIMTFLFSLIYSLFSMLTHVNDIVQITLYPAINTLCVFFVFIIPIKMYRIFSMALKRKKRVN